MRWKQSMVPLKKVRKETSRPSDRTLRTFTLTSIPGSSEPIVKPSHSCIKHHNCSANHGEATLSLHELQSCSMTCK